MDETDFKDRPGSALASLIPDWAVSNNDGCKCQDFSRKMDKWGTARCEERASHIVEHLMSQRQFLQPVLSHLPGTMLRYGAYRLVRRAIWMSKG